MFGYSSTTHRWACRIAERRVQEQGNLMLLQIGQCQDFTCKPILASSIVLDTANLRSRRCIDNNLSAIEHNDCANGRYIGSSNTICRSRYMWHLKIFEGRAIEETRPMYTRGHEAPTTAEIASSLGTGYRELNCLVHELAMTVQLCGPRGKGDGSR